MIESFLSLVESCIKLALSEISYIVSLRIQVSRVGWAYRLKDRLRPLNVLEVHKLFAADELVQALLCTFIGADEAIVKVTVYQI